MLIVYYESETLILIKDNFLIYAFWMAWSPAFFRSELGIEPRVSRYTDKRTLSVCLFGYIATPLKHSNRQEKGLGCGHEKIRTKQPTRRQKKAANTPEEW